MRSRSTRLHAALLVRATLKVADLFAVQESARAMVVALLERVGAEGAVPERDVELAKLYIGPLSRRFAAATIQLHGGMGMAEELSASRLARRLLMVEFEYGDAAFYEARLLSRGQALPLRNRPGEA